MADVVTRSIELVPSTVNAEARTIDAVIVTENQVTSYDQRRRQSVNDVALMRGFTPPKSGQVPLLDTHNAASIDHQHGSIRNFRVEGGNLVGTLHFASDEGSQRAFAKVSEGHVRDLSGGIKPLAIERVERGATREIDGRVFRAEAERPLLVYTNWTIREGSITPIGADADAKTRAGVQPMKDSTRQYLESLGLRSEATDEQAQAFLDSLTNDRAEVARGIECGDIKFRSEPHAQISRGEDKWEDVVPQRKAPETPPAKSDPPPVQRKDEDPATAARTAIEAERARVARAQELAGDDVPQEVVQRAISEGWDDATMTAEYLKVIRTQRNDDGIITGAPSMQVRSKEKDCTVRALAAGLLHRTNTEVIDAEFNGDYAQRLSERDADMGDRYRKWPMADLCREALRLDGQRIPHDRDEMIRAATSTTSLSNIFTTSIHARLMAAYMEAPDTSGWAQSEDVANFQTQDRALLGKTGSLDKLARGDTAKHATWDDLVESYKVHRFAKQFAVDDQDIQDDNLSGIQQMPTELGLAAARVRPDLVYAILLENAALDQDSTALFHANHNNTDTNAFSAANLGTGVTTMYQQTQDSVRLNLRPAHLIVNPTLEWTSRETITSGQLIASDMSAAADSVRGSRNVMRDLGLNLVVEGRLDATGVTHPVTGTAHTGSTTTWFLASATRTITVGYLAGTRRRPVLRRYTLDRGQWGIGWDIKLDIGGKAMDFRGLYRGNT